MRCVGWYPITIHSTLISNGFHRTSHPQGGGNSTKAGPTKGEKKRLAKKRRLDETGGGGGGGGGAASKQPPGPGQGKKGKKKYASKEERRARFLRPKKHQQQHPHYKPSNRPGSAKRGGKVYCFGCRKAGHRLSECPEKGQAFAAGVEVGEGVGRVCFNCGSTEHRLANCKKPRVNGACARPTCLACLPCVRVCLSVAWTGLTST